MERILLTGGSGPIGKRLIDNIMDLMGDTVEYLLVVEEEDIQPAFGNSAEKFWVRKNLWETDPEWWDDLLEEHQFNKVIYIETIENKNIYIPTPEELLKFRDSDSGFLEFLNTLSYIGPAPFQVLYLSTDKMYKDDEFPNELNPIMMYQPEGNEEGPDNLYNYASQKVNTELGLTSLTDLSLRIIRPFSIVSPEQKGLWPLTKIVAQAISNVEMHSYADGATGLAFTHVDDLVTFLLHPNLFSEEIILKSRIINFCRVWNYLPEQYLLEKVKAKTESDSDIIINSDINEFKYVQKTPQIRQMVKIFKPVIPIEKIIEDVHFQLDPTNDYVELEVSSTHRDSADQIYVSGIAEPLAGISVFLETGEILNTDADEIGSWTVSTEEPNYFQDYQYGTVYATTKEDIQYDTVIFVIPPATTEP